MISRWDDACWIFRRGIVTNDVTGLISKKFITEIGITGVITEAQEAKGFVLFEITSGKQSSGRPQGYHCLVKLVSPSRDPVWTMAITFNRRPASKAEVFKYFNGELGSNFHIVTCAVRVEGEEHVVWNMRPESEFVFKYADGGDGDGETENILEMP